MAEKLKILFVSNGFYPEISPRSFRATELAKEFCRQGHSVSVITRFRDYDYTDFLKEYSINIRMWGRSTFQPVPSFRKKPFSVVSRVFSRVMLTYFEYPAIENMFRVRRALKSESSYDLMISFAVPYPVHWGVALSRKGKHRIATRWIADCGDPYMGDVLDSFRKPFYFGYLEKLFCRRADFITIPVESARQGYYKEFHNKIRIIPQGFDFDLASARESKINNEVPEFAYAGGFLKGIRDPSLLMQFLMKIDLPFRFYLFTDKPDSVEEYWKALNGKMIVSGYIQRNELMSRLSGMDFLINFDNNTPLNVPSKLIDYAITGRPVLNIDKSFNFGDILAFIKGDYTRRMDLPEPGQYHIRNVAEKFFNILEDKSRHEQ
jgi:hypothetical protein